jgi:tetratricopeptide (TPR) repeat protein
MAKKRRRGLEKKPERPVASEVPEPAWPGEHSRRVILLGAALIVLLTLGIYSQSLAFPTLEFDDSFHLVHSPYVNVAHPFTLVGTVWDQPYFGFFDPVTTTSWMVDRVLADKSKPFDAVPFRASQLFYAMVCAGLVFLMFHRLRLPLILAALGGALYAVHPIHTEVVAWLSGRKDLMALLFIVLSFLAYLWARAAATPGQWRVRHIVTALLSLLAVLAKPVAIVIPLLFIAYEFCSERPDGVAKPIVKRTLGLAAIFLSVGGASALVFRNLLQGDVHGGWLIAVVAGCTLLLLPAAPRASGLSDFLAGRGDGLRVLAPPFAIQGVVFGAGVAWTVWAQSQSGAIKGGLPFLPTLNLTFEVMLAYAGKMLVPAHLSPYYVFTRYPAINLQGVCGALLILGLAAAAVVLAGAKDRSRRMVAFGILWYGIAFIPTSNFVPTSIKMADRYEYVPSVGAILAVLALAAAIFPADRRRQTAVCVALGVVACAYTVWSYRRTQVWSGDLSLWTSAAETHPDNYFALTSLGLCYLRLDPPQPEKALPFLQRALEVGEGVQAGAAGETKLDVSPELEALGDSYLAMAEKDTDNRQKEYYMKAVEYLQRGSMIPVGFAPADERLQLSLANARDGLASLIDREAAGSAGDARAALILQRDTLRDQADAALQRAREILIAGNVSRDDPDFRAAVLEAGTAVFKREAGASPGEQLPLFRKALALYQDAAAMFPDDPRPALDEGLCYQRLHLLEPSPQDKQKRFDQGVAVLQQALTLRTRAPDYNPLMAYRVLALLNSDAGDFRSALGFLKQVQQLDPTYSRTNNVDRDIQTLEGFASAKPK